MSVTFRSRLAARAAAVATLVMLSVATSAPAQSFNVDIDLQGSNPALGSGVPSSTFGGAAGQPGVWNAFQTSGPTPLVEIGGVPTAATVAITSTSTTPTILGFNNPDQTGDFGLLLNDGAQIGTTAQGGTRTYRFSGLIPGPYFITTYTARPGKFEGHLLIDVPGSAQGQLTASGVPTANTFTEGVTHVTHFLQLSGSTIDINLTDVPGAPAGYVDGFQVILLPEPASLAALIAPALLLRRPGPRLRRGIIRS
jgi:hypothetical protein